jgi:hypothetical protein
MDWIENCTTYDAIIYEHYAFSNGCLFLGSKGIMGENNAL